MRVAVVGHVEWTRIARVNRLPSQGDVIHAVNEWEGPAGGGAVAAVQLAKLAGECVFFTALGDDDLGERSRRDLERRGVRVVAAARRLPTRQAISLVDEERERTTITLGGRLQPSFDDSLPWAELGSFDAVYFTAGDPPLLGHARSARVLVVTCRELSTLAASGVTPDALVGSGRDSSECYEPGLLSGAPALLVTTYGAEGGRYSIGGEPALAYPAVEAPGPVVDAYGVGDSFAAALTYGLALDEGISHALSLAARCGAACACGRGPFDGQLALRGVGSIGADRPRRGDRPWEQDS